MANYSSTNTGANIDSAVNQIIDSSTDLNVDSNTLVVDKSANNVGIGVTAPGGIANGLSLTPDLEIRGAAGSGAACAGVLALTTAETSTVDGDVQGAIVFQSPIDASGTDAVLSGAAIWAEADATFSSSVNNTELVFATNSSAAATERMRIEAGGTVNITNGLTTGSNNTFDCNNDGTFALSVKHAGDDDGRRGISIWSGKNSAHGDGGKAVQIARGDGTEVGSITWATATTAFNTSSDYRLKENQVTLENGVTRVNNLKPYSFNFKEVADITYDGFFAHEVAEVVPQAVTGAKDAVDGDGNIIPQGIDHSHLVPLLTKAVQELDARVKTLEG